MFCSLRHLLLRHFRCFETFETEFGPDLNLIVGPNARGKTSLLEAASILLRLQSPRATRLAEAIQHDRRGLVVDGYLEQRHLQFYYSPLRRKLALDGVEQSNPKEYLQLGRLVYFSMADIELVRAGAEVRRRFLDFIALQMDPAYRPALRAYEKALRSRNALLKAPTVRWREVDAFTAPLLEAGGILMAARRALLQRLTPHAGRAHHAVSGQREALALAYLPGCGSDLATSLAESRDEDARLRQTSRGPHRDDVRLLVNERGSEYASEGQQRTMVLALKLAAARLLEEQFEHPPLLLLDDVFGELDEARRVALLAALPAGAQKLITTTTLSWWPQQSGARILRLGDLPASDALGG